VKQRLVLAAVAALCASILTACGGDGTKAYCDDLRSANKDFSSLDNADFSKFDEAISRMHSLADEAPDAVADDWKVLDGALNDLQDALKKAGLTTDDLAKMSEGQMPENFDMTKLQQLQEDMSSLGDEKFKNASDAIEKHAKSECNVDLGSS
jgi:hypothetical protein